MCEISSPSTTNQSQTKNHIFRETKMSIRNLYGDIETADIFFTFANSPDTKIPAHKCILAVKSSVFKQLFYCSSKECPSTIRIDDVSPKSFTIFLDLFYQRKLRLDLLTIIDVIHLSNTYKVIEWKEICGKFLNEQSNSMAEFGQIVSNVFFSTIESAFCSNQPDVQTFWEKLIRRHISDIIHNEQFLLCSRNVLNIVIGCCANNECDNEANVRKELFERCIAWAERKCSGNGKGGAKSLRNKLGSSFDLISFGSMTTSDFIYVLSKHANMFSVNEIQQISDKILSHFEGRP